MAEKVRIGIDVGGTFTHGVALAGTGTEVVAQAKVPTTHAAEEGVARGVVQALERLLEDAGLEPGDVTRVAHSTTQATNALLEGDVCTVGILAVGSGLEGSRVASETHLETITLAPGRLLKHHQLYLEQLDAAPDEARLTEAIETLRSQGAEAIVAATAFSVDDPSTEVCIVETARKLGLPATATHEISQLYGLRVRTRTAAINAAILPRMVATAEHTEAAVRRMGIEAPLVVMRSDGGAMDIAEMKRRPVLTLLSGPAAGVAAALMAGGVADGIFLEVGGTSTDVSCIQDGRPHQKVAQVGAHRLYLNTLDVRTLGIAGGSMTRVGPLKNVKRVGPRSAHIAGLRYAAFPGEGGLPDEARACKLAPLPADPPEYLALKAGERGYTVTPACAANLLGKVPEGDYAAGDLASVEAAFERAATFLETEPRSLAEQILGRGGDAILQCVEELVEEYELPRDRVRLIGGGGGAGVWVPWAGEELKLPASILPEAPVISAIGAALALIQEAVERTLVDPTPEDLASIREEVEAAVVRSGADPATVEVRVEVDQQRGVLRAVAVGSHELAAREEALAEADLAARAADLLGAEPAATELVARAGDFAVFRARVVNSSFFGFVKKERLPWRVLDGRGRVRVAADHGDVLACPAGDLVETLRAAMDRHADFGDAGKILPAAHVVVGGRTVDLSGMADLEQRVAICEEEVRRLAPEEDAVLVVRLA